MKRLSYFLAITLTPLLFFTAYAKENKDLMRANYYYAHYAYHDAIPYFEKVAGQLNDPQVYAQMADCYSVTGDIMKSADAYAKAVAIPGCADAVKLKYAQLLMQMTKYDEAAKWLKEYQKTNNKDVRVANLIAACSSAEAVLQRIPPGTATLLPFNTDGSDFAPAMFKGMLVFASDTAIDIKKKTDSWTGRSYYNIYSIQSAGPGQYGSEFNMLTGSKGVNIKYHTGPCTFTADGKQMYFTRSRYQDKFLGKKSIANKDSVVLLEIMIASDYDTGSRKFKTITPFQYNSEDYSVAHPSVSPNGKLLVFSSNMPKGAGGSDLYICRKMNTRWSKPQSLGNTINTEGEEVFPYWADSATLFFSSDGHTGLGGLDIYKSRYDAVAGTFSAPENIGTPINSSYDDISLALYADGRSTYFSSNRPAAKGSDNIYYYKREKIYLKLEVQDSVTGLPIAAAGISMDGTPDKHTDRTDNNGSYFTQLYPEEQYAMRVNKDEYGSKQLTITAAGTKETDTIYSTVKLYKPVPPPRDTMPKIEPVPLVVKTKNVMDTPGIGTFELNEIYELGHFYYEYNKSNLTEVHKVFLDTLLTQMRRHPTMCIEIRAHTDCRGSEAYNKILSENRALSVVDFLVKNGISRRRLTYLGLGYSMPSVNCKCEECTEEQHYLNRLLEFKVMKL